MFNQMFIKCFPKSNTSTVNLQKFVQLYGAVSTPMKQRNVVVDRIQVEHRLYRSSRKRQFQETGSYTVTISMEKPFPKVAMLH